MKALLDAEKFKHLRENAAAALATMTQTDAYTRFDVAARRLVEFAIAVAEDEFTARIEAQMRAGARVNMPGLVQTLSELQDPTYSPSSLARSLVRVLGLENAPAEPARLDPDGTAKGKTILTAPVMGQNGPSHWAGPASMHVDTETGKRTFLATEAWAAGWRRPPDTVQCPVSHPESGATWACQLEVGHDGLHEDCHGYRWTPLDPDDGWRPRSEPPPPERAPVAPQGSTVTTHKPHCAISLHLWPTPLGVRPACTCNDAHRYPPAGADPAGEPPERITIQQFQSGRWFVVMKGDEAEANEDETLTAYVRADIHAASEHRERLLARLHQTAEEDGPTWKQRAVAWARRTADVENERDALRTKLAEAAARPTMQLIMAIRKAVNAGSAPTIDAVDATVRKLAEAEAQREQFRADLVRESDLYQAEKRISKGLQAKLTKAETDDQRASKRFSNLVSAIRDLVGAGNEGTIEAVRRIVAERDTARAALMGAEATLAEVRADAEEHELQAYRISKLLQDERTQRDLQLRELCNKHSEDLASVRAHWHTTTRRYQTLVRESFADARRTTRDFLAAINRYVIELKGASMIDRYPIDIEPRNIRQWVQDLADDRDRYAKDRHTAYNEGIEASVRAIASPPKVLEQGARLRGSTDWEAGYASGWEAHSDRGVVWCLEQLEALKRYRTEAERQAHAELAKRNAQCLLHPVTRVTERGSL